MLGGGGGGLAGQAGGGGGSFTQGWTQAGGGGGQTHVYAPITSAVLIAIMVGHAVASASDRAAIAAWARANEAALTWAVQHLPDDLDPIVRLRTLTELDQCLCPA